MNLLEQNVSRDYLNGELGKYESWDKCLNESIKTLFEGVKGDFIRIKKSGVGQTTILKFLGDGWKQWKIQHALNVLSSTDAC